MRHQGLRTSGILRAGADGIPGSRTSAARLKSAKQLTSSQEVDFLHDQLGREQKLRVLTIADTFLAVRRSFALRGANVTNVLESVTVGRAGTLYPRAPESWVSLRFAASLAKTEVER